MFFILHTRLQKITNIHKSRQLYNFEVIIILFLKFHKK